MKIKVMINIQIINHIQRQMKKDKIFKAKSMKKIKINKKQVKISKNKKRQLAIINFPKNKNIFKVVIKNLIMKVLMTIFDIYNKNKKTENTKIKFRWINRTKSFKFKENRPIINKKVFKRINNLNKILVDKEKI